MRATSPVVLTLILGAFLTLSVAQATTQRPWCDEAWFFSPVINFLTTGSTGTLNFETAGTGFLRLDQRTYWTFPLHMVAQALWYQVFPATLLTMRALSIFWGATLVLSCFVIVRQLTGHVRLAQLAAALAATDYLVVHSAAEGRMDIMCAALGYSGLAAYLLLRDRHLGAAVVASHALLAGSALTHPNAVLHMATVALAMLYLDRARLGVRHLLLAAVPYTVAVLAWAPYIAQDPDAFSAQLRANGRGRWEGWLNPFKSVAEDLQRRYLYHVGGLGPDLTPAHRVKLIILIGYAAGVAGAFLAARRHAGIRLLLVLTAAAFLLLAVYDAQKIPLYLVHVTPWFCVCAAVAVWHGWSAAPRLRPVVAASVALFSLVQVAGTGYVVKRDTYRNQFLPVVEFLEQHWRRDTLLMGSAELTFALGLDPMILDDPLLGMASGRRAGMIVVEERYDGDHRDAAARFPATYAHIRQVLDVEHRVVYTRGPYRVYARRDEVDAALGVDRGVNRWHED